MSKRHQPGIPEQNIQAERKKREHEYLDNKPLDKDWKPQPRRDRQDGEHDPQGNPNLRRHGRTLLPLQRDVGGAHSTSSSSRSQARTSRTAAIRLKMMKLAAAGYTALP